MRPACDICSRLPPAELLELDALLGDPARWPSTVWAIFRPPSGGLPASYRRFGAQRVGREWLEAHGRADITTACLRRHIRYDVVHVARDAAELVQLGLITTTGTQTRIPTNPSLDAGAVIRYFNAGVQMGEAALRLAAERINQMENEGIPVDTKTLLEVAKIGTRLAATQASLQVRGAKFTHGEEDEDDAFRGLPDDLPGQRIGHHRSRVIEGRTRMVKDSGPADRDAYNERARDEAGIELD